MTQMLEAMYLARMVTVIEEKMKEKKSQKVHMVTL